MLNKEFVLQRIEPYLNSKRELSEFEFIELFASGDYPLSRQEQYEIIRIMIENDIEYVDEKDEEAEILKNVKIKNFNIANQDTQHLMNLKNEQLCVMAQNNDIIALAAICEKNKRFVYKMAIKLQWKYANCSLTIDDLVQEGMIGTMEAVARFDPNKELLFLTYARLWIRQYMERAILNTGFLVRLPVHVFEKMARINRYRKENPEASVREIIQIAMEDGCEYSTEEIAGLLQYSEQYLNITSLNTLVGDNKDTELIDLIPDDKDMSLEDEAILLLLRDDVRAALSKLTPQEIKVLSLRYGFGCDPQTFRGVGAILKLSGSRIAQIEFKALRKIKRFYAKKIEGYV